MISIKKIDLLSSKTINQQKYFVTILIDEKEEIIQKII